MAKLSKISKSKLTKGISFSENRETFLMNMCKKSTTSNMQEDRAAFEAWALYAISAGYKKVILSEQDFSGKLSAAEILHYNRFLYRVLQFTKGFEWFSVSDNLNKKISTFENTFLLKKDLMVNIPSKRAKSDTDNPEAKIERLLISKEKLTFMNNMLALNIEKYYNQLPVGLFSEKVARETQIFPGRKAAIDIWGIDGNLFHLIELKVKENKSLGVLSEIFFYANFINDMFCKRRLERVKTTRIRGFNKLIEANIKYVIVYILTEDIHPELNKLFTILQQCKTEKILFKNVVEYSQSAL